MEKRKIAEWLFGKCDLSIEAELPVEEQIESIIKALNKTPEFVLDYLLLATMDDKPMDTNSLEEPHISGTTDSGISYSDIARWLLSYQPMGKLFDYDDQTHYELLATYFQETPEVLMYYLGAASQNQ